MNLTSYFIGIITASILWLPAYFLMKKKSKRVESELQGNFQRLIDIVENSKDLFYHYQVKPERKFNYLSPVADQFFGKGATERGYSDPEASFSHIHPNDYEVLVQKLNGDIDYNSPIIQRWMNLDDGRYRWFEEYATPIYENGELVAVQGVIRDIDEEMKLQQDLQHRIHHDTLTDIHNREYLELVFTKYDEQVNAPVAIFLCDLDELKLVNDSFGHKAGDAMIKEAAILLDSFSSNSVTVARLAGDEFVLLAADITEEESQRLVDDIEQEIVRYNEENPSKSLKMSTGFAFTAHSLGNLNELFSEADKNMYREKMRRKGCPTESELVQCT